MLALVAKRMGNCRNTLRESDTSLGVVLPGKPVTDTWPLSLRRSPWTGRYKDPDVESLYVIRNWHDHRLTFILAMFIAIFTVFYVLFLTQFEFWFTVALCIVSCIPILVVFLSTLVQSLRKDTTVLYRCRWSEIGIVVSGATLFTLYGVTAQMVNVICANQVVETRPDLEPRYYCYRAFSTAVHAVIFTAVAITPRMLMMLPLLLLSHVSYTIGNLIASKEFDHPADLTFWITQVNSIVFHVAAGVYSVQQELVLRGVCDAAIRKHQAAHRSIRANEEVNDLIERLMPASAMTRMLNDDPVLDRGRGTVLFSDMVDFTLWCRPRTSETVVEMLSALVSSIDAAAEEHGVTKVKTIGDAYWAVCGLPASVSDHALRCISLAVDIHAIFAAISKEHQSFGTLKCRIGIHTAHVVGSVLGRSTLAYEVYGVASTVAQEIEEDCPKGRTLVASSSVQQFGPQIPRQAFVEERLSMTSVGPISCFLLSEDAEDVAILRSVSSERDVPRKEIRRGNPKEQDRMLEMVWEFRKQFGIELPELIDPDVAFKRRWRFFFQAFADQTMETKYAKFALKTSFKEGCATLCLLFAYLMLTAMFVAMHISAEGKHLPFFIILACLSLVPLVLFMVSVRRRRLPLPVIAGCFLVMFPTVMLSGALSFGTVFSWQGIHAQTFCVVAIFSGLSQAKSAFLMTFVIWWLWISAYILGRLYPPDLLYAMTLVSFLLVSHTREARKRSEFIQSHLAEWSQRDAEAQLAALETVMAHVLPVYVIPDLIREHRLASYKRKPITYAIKNAAILFCQFAWGVAATTHGSSYRKCGSTPGAESRSTSGSPLQDSLSATVDDLVDTAFRVPHEEDSEYVRVCGTLVTAVDSLIPGPDNRRSPLKGISKVKTIGNVIMIGSGLDPRTPVDDDDLPALCRALLIFSFALKERAQQMLPYDTIIGTFGMHVCPVTSAVIGRQQLMYDVFGSTVNLASRMMTESANGQMSCSKQFAAAVLECSDPLPVDVSKTVQSYGKGVGRFTRHLVQTTAM